MPPRPLRLRAAVHTALRQQRRFISHERAAPTRSPIADLLKWRPSEPVAEVTVDGYVRSVRGQKKFHFVTLGDGSSVEGIQAVVPADQADGLTVGAAVRFHGSWSPSQGRGQSHEMQVNRTLVLGPSDATTFPIQKKYQTPEYLRTLPHLRPRIPFNSALLRFRSKLIQSLGQFFDANGYTQTHTPILTSSDCEGAGEVFTLTTNKETSPAEQDGVRSFFRRPAYTTVSGQLHLEALAQAIGPVWTLSPTFRAEQSDTPRHLSEFYMLEAELPFEDRVDAVMDLAENMLQHVARDLYETTTVRELLHTKDRSQDLAPVDQVEARWQGLLQNPWPRITYTEAIELLKSAGAEFSHPPSWGSDLQTEHEKYIAATVGKGTTPVFVTHYPRDIKAFYMKPAPMDRPGPASPGATVECFDLLVPEFCEIAGGSMREHRLEPLLESMRLRNMDLPSAGEESGQPQANDLGWYVDLRRWGCPPHGGFGLGFDRLICYLSGVQTIRDTTAFPRWFGRCDC